MKVIKLLWALTFIIQTDCSFSQYIDSSHSDKTVLDTTKMIAGASLNVDPAKKDFNVRGGVTITNKGISYIPSLSLGKPAAIFDLSMAGTKLSFEPQLRFSLNGEPWSFLFSVRYKIKATGKFQLSAGINPLLNFKNVTYIVSGASTTELVNRRYLGMELRPTYFITKSISAGAYYLYFRGVSDGTLKNTNFVSVNINFLNIKLGSSYFARFSNQFYYLKQDGFDGFYINPVLALLKRNFPFSIQSIMNAIIHTDIPGSEKFIWNISLVYAFNKIYTQKQDK